MFGELPCQFQEGYGSYLSIAVDVANLFTFLEEILRGGHFVLVGCCPDGAIQEDGVV